MYCPTIDKLNGSWLKAYFGRIINGRKVQHMCQMVIKMVALALKLIISATPIMVSIIARTIHAAFPERTSNVMIQMVSSASCSAGLYCGKNFSRPKAVYISPMLILKKSKAYLSSNCIHFVSILSNCTNTLFIHCLKPDN